MNDVRRLLIAIVTGALPCASIATHASAQPAPPSAAEPEAVTQPTPPATSPARPEPARGGLSEQAAVERAVLRNPDLHVALLQATQAEVDVRAEEGLYSAVARANAGVTRSREPRIGVDDRVRVGTTDFIDVGAGIAKPFSTGTVLDLSLAGRRTVSSSDELEAAFGPTYSVAGRLTLTQPLLRGAGSDVGLASLRQARLRRTAAELIRDATASALLQSVLRAYWELWLADQVIRINEASRELAREQARQADAQVKSGALAEIDALVYRTRSAELDEAVVLATTERKQRALALAVLLAESGGAGAELVTTDAPPEPTAAPLDAESVIAEAERSSPELARLKTQIELTRDQLLIAGDPLRPRLDLGAWVEVQGLGNRSVPPAFEQVGRLDAVSAHVGLTFEAPLDGTRRRAQIASLELSRHIAEKELEAARQRLESDVRSAIAAREAAEKRVLVAAETVRVASAQADAERRRFAAGISIALSVQEAEDSLRQAQLRLERARVDWNLAEIQLLYLRGRLLERYRSVVARLAPSGPRLDTLPKTAF